MIPEVSVEPTNSTSSLSNRGKRIIFIDSLRGLTMFLVVYNHIAGFAFDIHDDFSYLCSLFRMPLFFFISGFLAYGIYDRILLRKRFTNRLLYQLLPTVVMCGLFTFGTTLGQSDNMRDLMADVYKNGYWFTWVAFQFFVLYMVVVCLFKTFKLQDKWYSLIFACIILSVPLLRSLLFRSGFLSSYLGEVLSIKFVLYYLPFFFFGLLMRNRLNSFLTAIKNKWVMMVMILGFLVMYWWHPGNFILIMIQGLVGVSILFRIFEYYKETFSSSTLLGRIMSLVGRYTLEIYLFHYFIVYSYSGLAVLPDFASVSSHWAIQLLVVFPLACITIGICLIVAKMIQISPPLYTLLFGRPKAANEGIVQSIN